MSRPKLEIASWIAGIVSAIIAIVVLAMALWPSLPSSGFDFAELVRAQQPSSSQTSSRPTLPRDVVRERWTAGPNALAAAQSIENVATRDKELTRLAAVGVSYDELDFALQAAKLIASEAKRDEVLEALSCWLIRGYATNLAQEAAISIGEQTRRDRVLKSISSHEATARTMPAAGADSTPVTGVRSFE